MNIHKMSIQDILRLLEKWNTEDCTCTPKQETGEDPTTCRSCGAGDAINHCGAELRDVFEDNFGTSDTKATV